MPYAERTPHRTRRSPLPRIAVAMAAALALAACDPAPSRQPALPSVPAASTAPTPAPSRDAATMEAIDDLSRLSSTPVHVQFDGGAPVAVRATVPVSGSTPTERALDYFRQTRELYGLDGPEVGLRPLSAGSVRGAGLEVTTFQQAYLGVAVIGAEIAVATRDGQALGSGGPLRSELAVATIPTITAAEAVTAATRLGVGAAALGRPQLAILDPSLVGGAGRLVPAFDDPRLVWRVRTLLAGAPNEVLVDATTGVALQVLALTHEDHASAVVVTSFDNETWSGNEESCGLYVAERDGTDFETGFAETFFADATDWYLEHLGVWSWDNLGAVSLVRINTLIMRDGEVFPNARWVPGCTVFEFSDDWIHSGTQQYRGIAVHEFQHAVTDGVGGDLAYNWISGAVNESYSDVFAMFVTEDDFLPIGGGGRSLSDPNSSGQPDRWSERFSETNPCGPAVMDPCTADADYPDKGWVHSNSGIGNFIGYLLRTGGTHPDTGIAVAPIAGDRLPELYLEALILLPRVADYWTLRWAFETVAAGNPDELCSVRNAFGAVEIGAADQDCDGTPDPLEDEDHDSIVDGVDSCPDVANPTQSDLDADGQGDACDSDLDGDGIAQSLTREEGDNCPDVPNADQADADRNGIGTACDGAEDGDADGDMVADGVDNCAQTFNPRPQPDADVDGSGDACDSDLDGDGRPNADDNCRGVANADQLDGDRDGIGDACDTCPTTVDAPARSDSTAFLERTGALVVDQEAIVPDSDGDGIWDSCDRDVSGDGASIRFESSTGGLRAPGSDGPRADLTLSGDVGGSVELAVILCQLVCDQPPAPDGCMEARISGADATTRITVRDDSGTELSRATGGSEAVVRWSPEGATSYELAFQLLGQTTGDELSVELALCTAGRPTSGSTPSPAPPLPTFGAGTATVEYTVGGSRIHRLESGRCAVAELGGYAFSVSAGQPGTGEFIAVAAMGISLPLSGSWTATITGSDASGPFAALDGVLAFGLGGTTGAFSGTTSTGDPVQGTYAC